METYGDPAARSDHELAGHIVFEGTTEPIRHMAREKDGLERLADPKPTSRLEFPEGELEPFSTRKATY